MSEIIATTHADEPQIAATTEPLNSESTDITSVTNPSPASRAPEMPSIPFIPFRCHRCAMQQLCNYHGISPPFAPVVRLPAPFYVKRNPFAPPPSAERPSAEYYLLLGADCARCDRQVCRATGCSIFYAQTICLECAELCITDFPTEIRAKINRALCTE